MPEPGFNDFDFDGLATKPSRGPAPGRAGRKRSPARKRLPLEFAEFRLNDGRVLGDVVGPGFFGPPSGSGGGPPLPRDVLDRLTENRSPLGGIMRDDPRIAPRPADRNTEQDYQGVTGELPIPPIPDYSADYMDPVPRPLYESTARADGPVYLMSGQAKFHDGETDAIDRIAGAATMAVSGLFESPLGIAHEDLGPMVNQSREDTLTPIFGTIRAINEILIEGGTQLGDLALRTMAAPIIGGAAAVGQTLIELGTTETTARRIMRDIIAFADSQMGSPAGGGSRIGAAARKGKHPKDFRPVESTLLFDDAERSGVLVKFLDQFPPGERSGIKEALRQSYVNGREVAATEIGRRGLGQVLSRPGGALAELELRKFEGQWGDRTKPVNPNRIYGSTFSNLSPKAKRHLKPATNSAMGAAGERHAFDLANKMDPQARREVTVETPPQFKKNRRYDFVGRRWSDQAMEEARALYSWLVGGERRLFRAMPVHSEAKTGAADLSAHQRKVDAEVRANPGSFGDPPVTSVSALRIFDHQVPLEKAFKVVDARMSTLVKKGRIDEATKEVLLSAMISMREGGRKTITLADYADLYTKFVPAAVAKGAGEGWYGASSEED